MSAVERSGADGPFRKTLLRYLPLLFLAGLALLLRREALYWMMGLGVQPDTSFHPDDQRFVDHAHDFSAGMPDGYVYGMTVHLLLLARGWALLVGEPLNYLLALKLVTLAYCVATVFLVYALARELSLSRAQGLGAAFCVVVAPLHVVNSHFGTPDVATVFYFHLALLCELRFLRTRREIWYFAAAAAVGAAMALKFFLPVGVSFAVVTLCTPWRQWIVRGALALVTMLFSFELLSFFAYDGTQLARLIDILRTDNLSITGGNGPIRQAALYAWDAVTAFGVLGSALVLLAVGLGCARLFPLRLPEPSTWIANRWVVATSGLLAHAVLIVFAEIHAIRHLLVFVPAAAIAVAWAWSRLLASAARPVRLTALALVAGWSIVNASFISALFAGDVRAEVATHVAGGALGRPVQSIDPWPAPAVTPPASESASLGSLLTHADLLSCDLIYRRYIRTREASEAYGTVDGQARLEFYWRVFEAPSGEAAVLRAYRSAPVGVEQWMIDREILRPLGTFVPKQCLIIGQPRDGARPVSVSVWPRVYFTAGW